MEMVIELEQISKESLIMENKSKMYNKYHKIPNRTSSITKYHNNIAKDHHIEQHDSSQQHQLVSKYTSA